MDTKKSIYLVTGAAGFIGSYLCRALLKTHSNATVVGIDTINNYYDPAIKLRRIRELSQNKRFIFHHTSILHVSHVKSIFAACKPSVLIHTAAQVGVRNGEKHPNVYYTTNIIGTSAILNEARPYLSHALVFSSSSVYGSTIKLPFRESYPIPPSMPLSVYGTSKIAMESVAHAFYRQTNIPTTIVRPFSIYGPDGRPDMLPMRLLISAYRKTPLSLYAPTETWRDWTYIEDFIPCVLALLNKPKGIRIINIGSSKPIRLDKTVAIAQKELASYHCALRYTIKPPNPTEMSKTWADTTRLQLIHPIKNPTEFDEGFKQTAKFFFSHVNLYR